MAYPSIRTWKFKATTTHSASRRRSYFHDSSSFLFSSAAPNSLNKRSSFITFSFKSASSSSSPPPFRSSGHSTLPKRSVDRKYSQNTGTSDGSLIGKLVSDDKALIETPINKVEIEETLVICKKQPFWRSLCLSKKFRSIILLNVITIVYASDIPVLKAVETVIDPAAFCAVRFLMSAVPFLPFVIRARDDVQTRKSGAELGLWVSLAYLAEAVGLLTSEAGRASFISLFTVLVVPLLDGMFGAIIPARTWFGVFMSALGVAMLECSGSPASVGDLLNFLSAIFFGIHMLRTEHISRRTKKENLMALLGYEVCVVALFSTLWVLIGGWFDGIQDVDKSSWTWEFIWDWMVAFPWIPALYTGILSTGLCLWIEFGAMTDVTATETAIIYGMEPLWGAGFAWFLLGERWGAMGWVGAVLVLGGSLMVQINGSSNTERTSEVKAASQTAELLLVSELKKNKVQKGLSASPVVVTSSNDVMNIYK